MSFERQFVLASRGLALLGVVALATTGTLGGSFVAIAFACISWTAVRGWRAEAPGLDNRVANVAILGAMVVIFAPVLAQGAPTIEAIAEFLLVLTALRAVAATSHRDWFQVYALSFFELVAASALTVEPVFAAVFVAYLLLTPWALVLHLLRAEMVDAGQAARLCRDPIIEGSLFRSVASVTVLLFVCTLTVFVFFPRVGAGLFASPLATGAALSGFSDEVGLGDVTALKRNDAVALRVSVDRPERIRGPGPYWRGSALDSFDGRRWSREGRESRTLTRAGPNRFLAREGALPGTFLRQEVILEPMEYPTLFFLGAPLQVEGRFPTLALDSLGNLRAMAPAGARIRYEVLSSLDPRREPPPARSRKLPPVDPRVRDLVRNLVSGIAGEAGRVEALQSYLRRGFRYSTEPGDPGDADPLARFLLETRQGHCEYFASSLAVMLRLAGIPSLVINGYLGGEWNPYGEYFVIRQSDAHSWVEAYLGGAWVILDSTPASGRTGGPGSLRQLSALLDTARMRWYRYVVNYDLKDQVDLTLTLRDTSRRLWDGLRRDFWRGAWSRLRSLPRTGAPGRGLWWLAVFAALALLGLALMLRRRRRAKSRAVEAWATVRYRALLRLLERRGLHKRAAETPDEFYRKIAPDLAEDRAVVERLTALYQQARFSGAEPPPDPSEVDRLLSDLERRA